MQQYPQVVAAQAIIAANLVFVALVEKYLFNYAAVALRQRLQYLAYVLLRLLVGDDVDHASPLVWNFGSRIFERVGSRRAISLTQHIRAHCIHECAYPLRFANSAFFAQGGKYPRKSLLPRIFHVVRRTESRPQFQLDQFTEIGDKMLLRVKIAG